MGLGISGYGNMYNWQYSPFGAAGYVSPSISYPVDSLGALNDVMLFNNNAGVDRLVADSTMLYNTTMPMLNQFMANMGQYWQQMMLNMSNGSSSFNIGTVQGHNPFKLEHRTGGADGASDSGKIKEGEILSTLEKMGRGDAVSDVMNKEIDIDGEKTTLLKRLMELVSEYRNNPDARLSEENYNKIWEIVDRYQKNGDLSTEDLKTLMAIVKDPSSTTSKTDTDPVRERTTVVTPEQIEAVVTDFKDAIIGAGTNTKKLGNAVEAVNKDNILEVMEAYSRYVRAHKPSEKDNLVEAILDDCRLWGGGDTNAWNAIFDGPVVNKIFRGKWFAKQGDDAKPRLEFVQKALIARANELIKNYGEEYGITKEDVKAFTLPTEESYGYFDEKRDDETILKSFNTFIEKLQAAENAVYGDNE